MFPVTGAYYSKCRLGVGGDPVQNQGELGGSKAELSINKGSHFRSVLVPGK